MWNNKLPTQSKQNALTKSQGLHLSRIYTNRSQKLSSISNNMFRFTVFAIILLYLTSWVESISTEVCDDLARELAVCGQNAPDDDTNNDDYNFDACTECIGQNKLFQQFDRQSCVDVTNEVCLFMNLCIDVCYDKEEDCYEERIALVTCSTGAVYGPEGCFVTCEGFGGGSSRGGDNEADDPNDSTSAGFTTTTVAALSSSAFALSVVAALFS